MKGVPTAELAILVREDMSESLAGRLLHAASCDRHILSESRHTITFCQRLLLQDDMHTKRHPAASCIPYLGASSRN
jgi:hypothetical protein